MCLCNKKKYFSGFTTLIFISRPLGLRWVIVVFFQSDHCVGRVLEALCSHWHLSVMGGRKKQTLCLCLSWEVTGGADQPCRADRYSIKMHLWVVYFKYCKTKSLAAACDCWHYCMFFYFFVFFLVFSVIFEIQSRLENISALKISEKKFHFLTLKKSNGEWQKLLCCHTRGGAFVISSNNVLQFGHNKQLPLESVRQQ